MDPSNLYSNGLLKCKEDVNMDNFVFEGKKNDRIDGKQRWDLLPLPLIEEIVKVYTFGAGKYEENSWQNLPDGYRRYKAALLRHLVATDKGEVNDPESGLNHLAHVAWNAIAMLHFKMEELRQKEVVTSPSRYS